MPINLSERKLQVGDTHYPAEYNQLIDDIEAGLNSNEDVNQQQGEVLTAANRRLTTLETSTEKRYVQTITIGGSRNFLYPVFWQFPNNHFGVGKLEISRHYGWHPSYFAALLLQIEGNDTPWGGGATYIKVRKYHWQYNKTASHLRFLGYARRERAGGSAALYGAEDANYTHSGIYLRGGGLDYRFSSNWPMTLVRLSNENSARARAVLHEQYNTRWYVQRIPFSALEEPTED